MNVVSKGVVSKGRYSLKFLPLAVGVGDAGPALKESS